MKLFWICALGMLSLLGIGSDLLVPEMTIAGTTTFQSGKDTYISEIQPTLNFGSEDKTRTNNKLDDELHAYYYFDISSLAPEDSVVSATLRLWVVDEVLWNVKVHRVLSFWDEYTLTWDNGNLNYDPPVLVSFVPSVPDAYVSIDITPLVQSWHKGVHPNEGLMMDAAGNDQRARFSSREWVIPSQRPELEITTTPIAVPTQTSDLVISKTVDQPTAPQGATVTYTIILGNAGPDDATGITILDMLPAGVSYMGSWATQGTYNDVNGIWTVGDLDNAMADTLRITVKVD